VNEVVTVGVSKDKKRENLRLGLILGALAAASFLGFLAKMFLAR
jgi:hypothetical protein